MPGRKLGDGGRTGAVSVVVILYVAAGVPTMSKAYEWITPFGRLGIVEIYDSHVRSSSFPSRLVLRGEGDRNISTKDINAARVVVMPCSWIGIPDRLVPSFRVFAAGRRRHPVPRPVDPHIRSHRPQHTVLTVYARNFEPALYVPDTPRLNRGAYDDVVVAIAP